jgi:hypothetical protein
MLEGANWTLIFKSFTERLLDDAPLELKGVEAPDSQTCPSPPQLTEPESMSGVEFFLPNILCNLATTTLS